MPNLVHIPMKSTPALAAMNYPSHRTLRVMHLVGKLGTGGMENGIINICHNLPQSEFQSSICIFEPGGAMEERIDRQIVDVFHVTKRIGNDPILPIRLAGLLSRQRIDILHLHNWGTLIEGVIAAKLCGTTAVVHGEHGMIYDQPRQVWAQKLAWRRVDRVLAVSDALADRMSETIGYPKERIQIIPNGVDSDFFSPCQQTKEEAKRQLGLPADGLLVGIVARFVPFKNHLGAIRALAVATENGSPFHLALAGDGQLAGELRQLVGNLNLNSNVHFLGELERVRPFLHSLDVFLSNSTHREGMSNAVLEAMACRLPVIATRVAASPELLDDGSSGILIQPGDDQALADAIVKLSKDQQLRSRLSEQARDRAVEVYGFSKMIESYRDLYRELWARKQLKR